MYFTLKSLQAIMTANALASDYYVMIESPRKGVKFDIIDKITGFDFRLINGYDTLKATIKSRVLTSNDDIENYICLSKPTEEDGSIYDFDLKGLFLHDLCNLIGTNLGIFKPGYYGKIKVGLYDASENENAFSVECIVSDLRVFSNMKVKDIDISLAGIQINAYPWWTKEN